MRWIDSFWNDSNEYLAGGSTLSTYVQNGQENHNSVGIWIITALLCFSPLRVGGKWRRFCGALSALGSLCTPPQIKIALALGKGEMSLRMRETRFRTRLPGVYQTLYQVQDSLNPEVISPTPQIKITVNKLAVKFPTKSAFGLSGSLALWILAHRMVQRPRYISVLYNKVGEFMPWRPSCNTIDIWSMSKFERNFSKHLNYLDTCLTVDTSRCGGHITPLVSFTRTCLWGSPESWKLL